MHRVYVLNNSYECVSLTSLARAIMLVEEGKAEVTKYAGGILRTSSHVLRVPKIIRIFRYIRAYGRTFRYSNRGVWERDDYVCQYCGIQIASKSDLTADHVLPRSLGGKETYENMVTACTPCNRRKGNRTPEQARMHLLRKPFRPPMSKRMHLIMQEVKAMLAEEEW